MNGKSLPLYVIIGTRAQLIKMAPVMKELEDNFYPDFNDLLGEIADDNNAVYINLFDQNKNLKFTDGQHLSIDDASKVSKLLLDTVLSVN